MFLYWTGPDIPTATGLESFAIPKSTSYFLVAQKYDFITDIYIT